MAILRTCATGGCILRTYGWYNRVTYCHILCDASIQYTSKSNNTIVSTLQNGFTVCVPCVPTKPGSDRNEQLHSIFLEVVVKVGVRQKSV